MSRGRPITFAVLWRAKMRATLQHLSGGRRSAGLAAVGFQPAPRLPGRAAAGRSIRLPERLADLRGRDGNPEVLHARPVSLSGRRGRRCGRARAGNLDRARPTSTARSALVIMSRRADRSGDPPGAEGKIPYRSPSVQVSPLALRRFAGWRARRGTWPGAPRSVARLGVAQPGRIVQGRPVAVLERRPRRDCDHRLCRPGDPPRSRLRAAGLFPWSRRLDAQLKGLPPTARVSPD